MMMREIVDLLNRWMGGLVLAGSSPCGVACGWRSLLLRFAVRRSYLSAREAVASSFHRERLSPDVKEQFVILLD